MSIANSRSGTAEVAPVVVALIDGQDHMRAKYEALVEAKTAQYEKALSDYNKLADAVSRLPGYIYDESKGELESMLEILGIIGHRG